MCQTCLFPIQLLQNILVGEQVEAVFDAYTGPYKDSARFWTRLLLISRLFLLLVHTFDNGSHVLVHSINGAFCLILSAVMITLNGVYRKQYLNVLEYSFILNIGLFFIFSIPFWPENLRWRISLNHASVSVAFMTFLLPSLPHLPKVLGLWLHCLDKEQGSTSTSE